MFETPPFSTHRAEVYIISCRNDSRNQWRRQQNTVTSTERLLQAWTWPPKQYTKTSVLVFGAPTRKRVSRSLVPLHTNAYPVKYGLKWVQKAFISFICREMLFKQPQIAYVIHTQYYSVTKSLWVWDCWLSCTWSTIVNLCKWTCEEIPLNPDWHFPPFFFSFCRKGNIFGYTPCSSTDLQSGLRFTVWWKLFVHDLLQALPL